MYVTITYNNSCSIKGFFYAYSLYNFYPNFPVQMYIFLAWVYSILQNRMSVLIKLNMLSSPELCLKPQTTHVYKTVTRHEFKNFAKKFGMHVSYHIWYELYEGLYGLCHGMNYMKAYTDCVMAKCLSLHIQVSCCSKKRASSHVPFDIMDR